MNFFMFSVISTQLKVLNPIIKGVAINMMNLFRASKIPSKILLHNKPMLHDVFFTPPRIGMIGAIYKFIFKFPAADHTNIPTFKIDRLFTWLKLPCCRVSEFIHIEILAFRRQIARVLCAGAS